MLLREAELLVEEVAGFPTATLFEADPRCGALPSGIKPVAPGMRLSGPALTVRCPAGDNLWVHRALYDERAAGSVLVVSVGQGTETGYWGEILSVAAQSAGLRGLIIDGCVRDSEALAEVGFPVFAPGLCIRGTTKDPAGDGDVGAAVRIGDVDVRTGDFVFGDTDGVVHVPSDALRVVLPSARAREDKESTIKERLRAGARTLDIYGLAPVANPLRHEG